MVQWLGLGICTANSCQGVGSIPCQGHKILHVEWHNQKVNKNKCLRSNFFIAVHHLHKNNVTSSLTNIGEIKPSKGLSFRCLLNSCYAQPCIQWLHRMESVTARHSVSKWPTCRMNTTLYVFLFLSWGNSVYTADSSTNRMRGLPNTNSCVQCTVKPNKPKCQGLEHKKFYCRVKQGEWAAHAPETWTPG